MIIETLTNPDPYILFSGNAIKDVGDTVDLIDPEPGNDVCVCDWICDYVEKVFASPGNEWWKNDKNTFPFRYLIPADTIDIELWKNGSKLADIVDDTYGTLTDGYFGTGIEAQELYRVFEISWEKVMSVSGAGLYQIKASQTLLGVDVPFESHKFKLETYTDLSADGTVRIEVVQNGNILRSGFDFTGTNLSFSTRIPAEFKLVTPDTEQEMHLKQTYERDQVQTKLINNWELEVKLIPTQVSDALLYNYMLANQILITDYNILNEKIYRRISVVYEEVEKERESNQIKSSFLIKFTDRVEDILKRNY